MRGALNKHYIIFFIFFFHYTLSVYTTYQFHESLLTQKQNVVSGKMLYSANLPQYDRLRGLPPPFAYQKTIKLNALIYDMRVS